MKNLNAPQEGSLDSTRESPSAPALPFFPEFIMPTTPWAPEWICTLIHRAGDRDAPNASGYRATVLGASASSRGATRLF
jgi:hypothetical protein